MRCWNLPSSEKNAKYIKILQFAGWAWPGPFKIDLTTLRKVLRDPPDSFHLWAVTADVRGRQGIFGHIQWARNMYWLVSASSKSCKLKLQNENAKLLCKTSFKLEGCKKTTKEIKRGLHGHVRIRRSANPTPTHPSSEAHLAHPLSLKNTYRARPPPKKKENCKLWKQSFRARLHSKRCTFTQLLCFYLFLFFSPLLPASLISPVLSFVLLSSSLLSSRLLSLGKFL